MRDRETSRWLAEDSAAPELLAFENDAKALDRKTLSRSGDRLWTYRKPLHPSGQFFHCPCLIGACLRPENSTYLAFPSPELLDSVVMSDVYLSYLSNSLDGSWRRLMGLAHRRHDISDRVWLLLEPHLPGRAGRWGGVAQDNRRFINAIFWILRTGAPWRDVPPDYGDWKTTHRRFCRWRDKGLWGRCWSLWWMSRTMSG